MAHPRKQQNQNKKTTSDPVFENFRFEPMRQRQAEAQIDFESGKNLVLTGYAGTGKTFIALAIAFQALLRNEIQHIHIVRSAVSGRDIGFLPGTEEEKLAVYEKAIRANVNKLFRRDDAYEVLKHKRVISFGSTSFERGITYDRTCIIVDEFQNLDFGELDTLVTRMGRDTRIIFAGDTRQSDLPVNKSGFHKFVRVAERVGHFFIRHEFEIDDIVRSAVVKAWIIAREDDHAANS